MAKVKSPISDKATDYLDGRIDLPIGVEILFEMVEFQALIDAADKLRGAR